MICSYIHGAYQVTHKKCIDIAYEQSCGQECGCRGWLPLSFCHTNAVWCALSKWQHRSLHTPTRIRCDTCLGATEFDHIAIFCMPDVQQHLPSTTPKFFEDEAVSTLCAFGRHIRVRRCSYRNERVGHYPYVTRLKRTYLYITTMSDGMDVTVCTKVFVSHHVAQCQHGYMACVCITVWVVLTRFRCNTAAGHRGCRGSCRRRRRNEYD